MTDAGGSVKYGFTQPPVIFNPYHIHSVNQ